MFKMRLLPFLSLIPSLPFVFSQSSSISASPLPSAPPFPSQNALASAVYTSSPALWNVTVPAEWNFTTILQVTNLSQVISNWSIVQNYSYALLDTLPNPFPGVDATPAVYVNGTYSTYATNALNYALQQDLNTSLTPYSDENWAIPVVCEWPISGMYSQLQRILFYVLLVFALVWRHHEWLIAGALAFATTYSGAAAVQAWVQFGVINEYKDTAGDNDNQAIMGILAASLLMAVPLVNWSRTLRRLGVRPILIYWALIVFAGYILVIAGEKMTEYSEWTRHAGGIMTCSTREQIPEIHNLGFLNQSFIQQYNCDDPCFNAKTYSPLHAADSVINRVICDQWTWTDDTNTSDYSCFVQCPRDIADTCYIAHSGWSERDFRITNVGYYGVLPVVVFELFLVLCFGRRSPEDIRDLMFKTLVGRELLEKYRMLPPSKRIGVHRSWRVVAAQTGGMAFYAFALLIWTVCVPFFIFNIVFQEWLLRLFPDASNPWEVDQWLPWVTVLLTLGAAIVGKYHHHWHVYIMHYLFGHPKPKSRPIKKVAEKGKTAAGWFQRLTWMTIERMRLEWRDVREFCNNPFYLIFDDTRERTAERPTVKFSFLGTLPYPGGEERYSRGHYKGPWIRNKGWNNFDVEFFVQAEDRTLRSWERHQQRYCPNGEDCDQHIVYSVDLPPVPSYPDKRTVMADANEAEILERVTEDPNAPNTGEKLTKAIVPGVRKASTASYKLQSIDDDDSTPSKSSSTTALSNNSSAAKKAAFVIETNIPPSRMSSIRRPSTPISPTDHSAPPVPPIPQHVVRHNTQPEESTIETASQVEMIARPPSLVSLKRKPIPSRSSSLPNPEDETTGVEQPLLGRVETEPVVTSRQVDSEES